MFQEQLQRSKVKDDKVLIIMVHKFKNKTLNEIADTVCGNFDHETSYFVYRSSSYQTEFFEDCELDSYRHDKNHGIG